jgi:small subunit ribosomal protein S20
MAKRTASARKQARAAERRAVRNRSVRSAVKTRVVRVRRALSEGAENVAELAAGAAAGLDRAASKGILHPNNAARRKSRLMKAVAAAAGADAAEAPSEAKKTAAPAKKTAAPAKKAAAKGGEKKTAAKAAPAGPRRPAPRRAARS